MIDALVGEVVGEMERTYDPELHAYHFPPDGHEGPKTGSEEDVDMASTRMVIVIKY